MINCFHGQVAKSLKGKGPPTEKRGLLQSGLNSMNEQLGQIISQYSICLSRQIQKKDKSEIINESHRDLVRDPHDLVSGATRVAGAQGARGKLGIGVVFRGYLYAIGPGLYTGGSGLSLERKSSGARSEENSIVLGLWKEAKY